MKHRAWGAWCRAQHVGRSVCPTGRGMAGRGQQPWGRAGTEVAERWVQGVGRMLQGEKHQVLAEAIPVLAGRSAEGLRKVVPGECCGSSSLGAGVGRARERRASIRWAAPTQSRFRVSLVVQRP